MSIEDNSKASVQVAKVEFDIDLDLMTDWVEERAAEDHAEEMPPAMLSWLNAHGGEWSVSADSVDAEIMYDKVFHTVEVSIDFDDAETAAAFEAAFCGSQPASETPA